jgi:hypothetical protein
VAKKVVVEIDGVRAGCGWGFIKNHVQLFAGKTTDAEHVLFSSRSKKVDLTGFHVTHSGVESLVLSPRLPQPYTEALLTRLVKDFLTVRRLLQQPTQAEAVELLAHDHEAVRDYARSHMAEWHKRWQRTSRSL